MKTVFSWTALLSLIGLLLYSVSVKAQNKTFPLGVPVQSQALFCQDLDSAKVIADNKGEESPEIDILFLTRKCFQGNGTGVYTKEVYRKGSWAVYEFSIGSRLFYEATDYRGIVPKPKGQLGV